MLLWSSYPKWMLRVWRTEFFYHLSIPRGLAGWERTGEAKSEIDGVFDDHMSAHHLYELRAGPSLRRWGLGVIIVRSMEMCCKVPIGEGSRKMKPLSIHPKSTSLHFSELIIAVSGAQGFLHFRRCLFQGGSWPVNKPVCRLTFLCPGW